MSQRKDIDYYLDWICRVHEEGCQKEGRQLSDEANETIRYLWSEIAQTAADRPDLFRLRRAAGYRTFLEAGMLMAKAAEMQGSLAVESQNVRAGTKALYALGDDQFLLAGSCDHPIVNWVCNPDSVINRANSTEAT